MTLLYNIIIILLLSKALFQTYWRTAIRWGWSEKSPISNRSGNSYLTNPKRAIFQYLGITQNIWFLEFLIILGPNLETTIVFCCLSWPGPLFCKLKAVTFFCWAMAFFSSALYILEESCLLSVARFWTLCEPARSSSAPLIRLISEFEFQVGHLKSIIQI